MLLGCYSKNKTEYECNLISSGSGRALMLKFVCQLCNYQDLRPALVSEYWPRLASHLKVYSRKTIWIYSCSYMCTVIKA